MATNDIFKFIDPMDNDARRAQFMNMFPKTEFINKNNEEGKPWGLHYWITPLDEREMALEYQRTLNPSSYYILITQIFRLLDERDNKEYLMWHAQRFCRSPAPAETLPGKEHDAVNYYGFHFKPLVMVDGYDFYNRPVNPKLKSIEIVYDVPWSKEAYLNLVNQKDSKFSGYKFYVGKASPNANQIVPADKSLIKTESDFINGKFQDLYEFGKSQYDTFEEFTRTKALSRKERQKVISPPSSTASASASAAQSTSTYTSHHQQPTTTTG